MTDGGGIGIFFAPLKRVTGVLWASGFLFCDTLERFSLCLPGSLLEAQGQNAPCVWVKSAVYRM